VAQAAPTSQMFRTILPQTDSTYDIGATANRFANGYFDNIDATTMLISGSSTGDLDGNGNILLNWIKLIGGSSTTSDLTLQTTSGVGATGADMHFLVGNNGGTEAMTVLNSGNVGIGTTTPGALLHLFRSNAGVAVPTSGNEFVIEDGSADVGLSLLTTSSFDTRIIMGDENDSSSAVFRWNGGSDQLNIGTGKAGSELIITTGNSVEAVRVDSSGNVGIGTTTPNATLTLAGSNPNDLTIRNGTTDSYDGISLSANNSNSYFTLSDNTGDSVYFDTTSGVNYIKEGNVGIGTTTPSSKLHVVGGESGATGYLTTADDFLLEASGNGGMSILVPDASISRLVFGSPSDTSGAVVRYEYTNNLMKVGTSRSNGDLQLMAGNAGVKMHIDSTGDIGIGTTAPTGKLTIVDSTTATANLVEGLRLNYTNAGNADSSAVAMLFDTSAGNDRPKAGIAFERTAANSRGTLHFLQNNVADASDVALSDSVMSITKVGDVGIGTTTPSFKLQVNGGVSREGLYYSFQPTAPTTLAAGSFTKLDLATVSIKDTNFYSESAGTVTIQKTGYYKISYKCSAKLTSGTREFAQCAIFDTSSQIADSVCGMYARETSGVGGTSCSWTGIKQFTSSDTIDLRFNPDTTGVDPKNNGATMTVEFVSD